MDMFVSAYLSRPVIHIKEGMNQGFGRSYALTFAVAIGKYGKELKEEYLLDAYRKVGLAFKGQLEQHFVVLRDSELDRVSQLQYDPARSMRGRGGSAFRGRARRQSFRGRSGFRPGNPQYSNQGNPQAQKRPYEDQTNANAHAHGLSSGFGSGAGFGTGFGSGFVLGNTTGALSNLVPNVPPLPVSFSNSVNLGTPSKHQRSTYQNYSSATQSSGSNWN